MEPTRATSTEPANGKRWTCNLLLWTHVVPSWGATMWCAGPDTVAGACQVMSESVGAGCGWLF